MRDAALLASKFFKELAEVFDGQGKSILYKKFSPGSTPKIFFLGEENLPAKMAGEIFPRKIISYHIKIEINRIITVESSKKQKLESGANQNGESSVKHSSKNGGVGHAGETKDSDKKKDKKKKSKKKDEAADQSGVSAIKKPLSAYMLFNNARRPTLQAEYPCK